MCYQKGKTRSSHQSWLDITNSFLQNADEIEKNDSVSYSTSTPMYVNKEVKVNKTAEKPMFILISEKEVENRADEGYRPYYKPDSVPAGKEPMKRPQSLKALKKYAPLPLKKFDNGVIPLVARIGPIPRMSSLRKFKF